MRPTIALAMIVKNEAHNIGPLLDSVKDCFDEIHITDTGSTDNTVEMLEKAHEKNIAGCPIYIHHFKWVNDFSAARNYSFQQVPKKIDYIMWMDGDDLLGNREAFIHFRDTTMHCAHYWLATYHYAFNEKGKAVCSFSRERVIKNNFGFYWNDFVHEGCIGPKDRKWNAQFIGSWSVNHIRTELDRKADRSRNLKLFEGKTLNTRMHYYYGKELFDNGDYLKAGAILIEAFKKPDLELNDRVMAIQVAAQCAYQCGKFSECLQMCFQGIQLSAGRAEYWNQAADCYLKLGKPREAIVFYDTARRCAPDNLNGMTYTNPEAYNISPTFQIAQIYKALGEFDNALDEVKNLEEMGDERVQGLRSELFQLKAMSTIPADSELSQKPDILITCPPGTVTKDWDERSSLLGGSETACVEVAKHLREKTGRPVKVFNIRETSDIMPSGVEYLPLAQLAQYLHKNKPFAHIAWRHAVRLTNAPSYVWSHDLVTMGAEKGEFDGYLCLSQFHKDFTKALMNVPEEKIKVLRNGIDPHLFNGAIKPDPVRNPFKVIFSSSPDRGLDRCIEIVKRARKEIPELELHLFYGFENMRKGGMNEMADRMEKMIRENDFVKFHGFVSKLELVKHFRESAVWLYPADFIETSCISAMEAICAGAYPLVRDMGALKYTLKEAIENNMATVMHLDASCEEEYQVWANELVKIVKNRYWEKVQVDPEDYSWSAVADEFIEELSLGQSAV